jgi:hypothetical protein
LLTVRHEYYGAFAPGLEGCIAEILKERFPDAAIPLLLSGAVVFETSLSYDRFNLFCFNNVFKIIGGGRDGGPGGGRENRGSREAPSREAASPEALEDFVRRTIRQRAGRELLDGGTPGEAVAGGAGSFRVVFSLENSPAAVREDLRREAENYIAAASGLRVNRSRPGMEFWFLLRREGAFFMRRLSHHRSWDKLLHPGELPPPLAWMLCKLSEPRPGERAADPFCGYGSIPASRLRHFPPAEFFASDIDGASLRIAKNKFTGKAQHHCVFNRCAVADLPRFIPPASLDSIITDPPWGFYQPARQPGGDLYTQSLGIFSGLLKPGGRVVLLCGRGEEPETAAEQNGFTVSRHIPILVSGKKAAIRVLRI